LESPKKVNILFFLAMLTFIRYTVISNKLKINFYGEALHLKKVQITDEQFLKWNIIASKMKIALYKALIDPYFYHLLKDIKIQKIDDLSIIMQQELINSSKNQIEIWYKNKKIQKLKINDLQEELLLFPLYNSFLTKTPIVKDKGIYIEQKEIGLIGSFELKVQDFNIDNLVFHLIESINGKSLQKVTYLNQGFTLKKTDSLIIYQNSFELKI
jgi:hypothetical protein